MSFRSTLSRVLTWMLGPDQPFEQLILFSWRGELIAICATMVVSFLVAGFWFPYWRVADMDFWIVYNAFLLNAHLPQEYFDHPGYLTILFLSEWLRALHGLGLVKVISLTALPPVSHLAAFNEAWTAATRAGRVLSLVYALSFVVAFAYLLRALVRDWRVALLGAIFLGFSGGMAMQMRILRTELLASGFFFCALLMLLIVARRGASAWRPAVVGLASLLITLAMLNKIQIIFLICALPVILLPFGTLPETKNDFWQTPGRAVVALIAAAALAGLGVYLAWGILSFGFTTTSTPTFSVPRLTLGARTYWTMIAVWFGLGMAAYAVRWKVSALEALTTALAVVAGCAIGLLALYARYNPNDVVVVFHPFEQMFKWASGSEPGLARTRPRLRHQVPVRVDRSRDPAAHLLPGIVAAPGDVPRMVRHRRDGGRDPAARLAARRAGRCADAYRLGRRHAGHEPWPEAGILPAHRSARHRRRRAADRQAHRS